MTAKSLAFVKLAKQAALLEHLATLRRARYIERATSLQVFAYLSAEPLLRQIERLARLRSHKGS